MESIDKDLRDKRIMDLNNSGKSIAEIAKEIGMSKGGVHKVLGKLLIKGDVAPKEEKASEIKISGKEDRFTSFVGWNRLNVNEYVNEKTGEVIRVAWVKAKSVDEFGYFVKLGSVGKIEDDLKEEKKSNPADVKSGKRVPFSEDIKVSSILADEVGQFVVPKKEDVVASFRQITEEKKKDL